MHPFHVPHLKLLGLLTSCTAPAEGPDLLVRAWTLFDAILVSDLAPGGGSVTWNKGKAAQHKSSGLCVSAALVAWRLSLPAYTVRNKENGSKGSKAHSTRPIAGDSCYPQTSSREPARPVGLQPRALSLSITDGAQNV